MALKTCFFCVFHRTVFIKKRNNEFNKQHSRNSQVLLSTKTPTERKDQSVKGGAKPPLDLFPVCFHVTALLKFMQNIVF